MAIYYVDLYNGNDSNNGLSWATAWKTDVSKTLSPGDIVKISKTPDPISIGTALWTDKSKTITLTEAQTKTIDNCETVWTNGIGLSSSAYSSYKKQGSYSYRNRTTTSGWTTGAILCYKTLPSTLDLSAFQAITFFWSYSSLLAYDSLRIRLCSDSAGAVVVDEFILPAFESGEYSTSKFTALTLKKVGGGNLSAAINSISIAYGTTLTSTYINGAYFMIDNISACKDGGLSLNTLISKNGNPTAGEEPFIAIQSIDETAVILDNSPACMSTAGLGYSGVTETVETYIREPFCSFKNIVTISSPGTLSDQITHEGGYNVVTGEQDGETYFDGVNGSANGIYATMGYFTAKKMSFFRYLEGAKIGNSATATGMHGFVCEFGELNNNANYALHVMGAGIYKEQSVSVKNICNNGIGSTSYAIYIQGNAYSHIFKLNKITSFCNNYSLGIISASLASYGDNRLTIEGFVSVRNNNSQNLSISNIAVSIGASNFYDSSWLVLTECPFSEIYDLSVESTSTFLFLDRCSNSKISNPVFKINIQYPGTQYGLEICYSTDVTIDNYRQFSWTNEPISQLLALKTSKVREINAYSLVLPNLINQNTKSEFIVEMADGSHAFYLFNMAKVVEYSAYLPDGVTGKFYKITSTNPNPEIELTIAEIAVVAGKQLTISIWVGGCIYTKTNNLVIEETQAGGTRIETDFAIELSSGNENPVWQQKTITYTPLNTGVLRLKISGRSNASTSYQSTFGWTFFGPLTISQAD